MVLQVREIFFCVFCFFVSVSRTQPNMVVLETGTFGKKLKYVSLSVSICEFKTCNLNTEYDFKKYSLAFYKIVV
jgi:hypothetical protein